jgi:malate dehydrogenase (oxaloacetate-decarboxylating)
VFALANPIPECAPDELADVARVVATGRSEFPNQLNNSLASPGIFRGALEARATDIDDAMKIAAARALANLVGPDELQEEYIIPSLFDRRVADTVAHATREAARASGLARRG